MSKTLIIGYGNPLRGDDGVGWRVAQTLAAEMVREDVEVRACQQLTPELAELISHQARVIFIDARAEGTPGSFACEKIEPLEAALDNFTHHVNPAGLLAWAKMLYGHCPEAYLLTITGEAFDYAEILSPRVASTMPQVIQRVYELWCEKVSEFN